MGYSPWGRKESDMTEQLHSLTHHKREGNAGVLIIRGWTGNTGVSSLQSLVDSDRKAKLT